MSKPKAPVSQPVRHHSQNGGGSTGGGSTGGDFAGKGTGSGGPRT